MSLTISALVTNYNTWSLTTRCIQELSQWSKENLVEILVVDDASEESVPDNLPDKVKVIQNNHNQGYVHSVNVGFAQLQEDLVILLDSDAYPLMDLTKLLTQTFTANPMLGAVGFQLVDEKGQPTGSSCPEPKAFDLLLGQALASKYNSWFKHDKECSLCLYSCGMAVRRSAFEEVSGFDEGFDFLDADIDFSIRLRAAGWHVQVDPSLLAYHKGGGSFQTTSKRVLRYHRNRWRLLSKHGLISQPRLLKVGLAVRHAFEYGILQVFGKDLIPEFTVLADKLHSRQQLLRQVWSAYGNER